MGVVPIGKKEPPPYGKRKGWVPRSLEVRLLSIYSINIIVYILVQAPCAKEFV